jgi:hypothetical protein
LGATNRLRIISTKAQRTLEDNIGMTMQVSNGHGAETVSSRGSLRINIRSQGRTLAASPIDNYHADESLSYSDKLSRLEFDKYHVEIADNTCSMSELGVKSANAESPPTCTTPDSKSGYSSPEDRYQHATERKELPRSDRDNVCYASPVASPFSGGGVSPTSVTCMPGTFVSMPIHSPGYSSRIEEEVVDGQTRTRGAFEGNASTGPLWYDPFARHGRKFVRKPRVTFPEEVVTKIRSVPRWEGSQKTELFYTSEEYMQFREELIYHHEATWENLVVDYCSDKWSKLQQVFGCKTERKEEESETSEIKP